MKERILSVFGVNKPIIGMLHLNGYHAKEIHELAKFEIEQMYLNGVDAILAEDYFGEPEDVEWALDYLKTNYPDRVYGVNMLCDSERGFALAKRYGASFIQIDSVCGHLVPGSGMSGPERPDLLDKVCDGDFEEKLAELRTNYPVFLLGGVRFKYYPVNSCRSVEEDLNIGKTRCDAIVVTGGATGMDTGIEKIQRFRDAIGDFPLFVGAGMTDDTCRQQLSIADGAIVGSWFKEMGTAEWPVDPERVRRFMEIVKVVREECS